MNHLDLFSGIGGFALAARWAAIETIAFCEIDPFCQKVLRKHWPLIPIADEIKTFTYHGQIDLLTAGFPCQPFSVAGKKRGVKDDRYLWPEVIRIIRECKPTWLVLENVPGIIPMLDPILEDLENEGYHWQAFLIPASSVSAPHKRERLWIIAHRDCIRRDNGRDTREERPIQINGQQYVKTLQSEWSQFQPESWKTFNAQEWLGFTADSDINQCDQGATDNEAEPIRSEWSESSTETGDVDESIRLPANTIGIKSEYKYNSFCEKELEQGSIFTRKNSPIGNTNSITSAQDNSSSLSSRESREAWENDSIEHWRNSPIFNWQKDQPPIPGVDDGLPNGLDRNRALGNAIVPQIPYLFMRMIKEIERLK